MNFDLSGDTFFIVLRKKPLVLLQWLVSKQMYIIYITSFSILNFMLIVNFHRYHHAVTLASSWMLTPLREPICAYVVILNYGVHRLSFSKYWNYLYGKHFILSYNIHSLMYPYFAIKALGYNPPRWVANFITTCQFVQMLIGFLLNIYSLYLISKKSHYYKRNKFSQCLTLWFLI